MNDAEIARENHSHDPGTNLAGTVFCVAILLSTLLFSFRFTSFLHAKEIALCFALCVLATLSVIRTNNRRRQPSPFRSLWVLLFILLVVHVLLGVAQVRTYAVEELARYALLLLLADQAANVMATSAIWKQRLLRTLAVSGAIVACLSLLQRVGMLDALFPRFAGYDQPMYSVFGNQDLLGGYLAMTLPLVVALCIKSRLKLRIAVPYIAVIVPALVLCGSRTAWLAAAVGLGLTGALAMRKQRVPYAIPATILVAGAIAMGATWGEFSNRVTSSFSEKDVGGQSRLWFWDASIRMIGDHTISGVGPGNFKYWSPEYQARALEANSDLYRNTIHTLHAHSDALELLAEAGIAGVLCVLILFWGMRKSRGLEWGALMALAVFGLFNSTLHSSPHLFGGLLLIASLRSATRTDAADTNAKPAVALSIQAALTLLVVVLLVGIRFVPSVLLTQARDAYDTQQESTEERYLRAASYPWNHYQAAEEMAAFLTLEGRTAETSRFLAFAIPGRDTGGLYYLIGQAEEEAGEKESAREAYRECLRRWPSYLPAWKRLFEVVDPEERAEVLSESEHWLSKRKFRALKKL